MDINTVKHWLTQTLLFENQYDWMVYVFAILLATALVSFIARMVLGIMCKAALRSKFEWDDIAINAAREPLRFIIWVLGITVAVDLLLYHVQSEFIRDIGAVREVAVVFAIAWACIRFINAGKEHYICERRGKGKNIDLTTVQAIAKLLKISLIVASVLIALQNLGVSIAGVLAFGGVGGIAIGFAAQDMLANFFGALIIYFDKPFKVGDWIRSPDQEIEGTVKEIGWRMTTIETFEKRPLYIPNSVFTKIAVENPSRMSHRRIYETIGIRYDDIAVMQSITDEVRAMLQSHEDIDEHQTLLVYFNAFNASSCDFFVYTFTRTTDWKKYHEVKHDVLLRIADIIAQYNAEIAYPTQVEYSMVRQLKDSAA